MEKAAIKLMASSKAMEFVQGQQETMYNTASEKMPVYKHEYFYVNFKY